MPSLQTLLTGPARRLHGAELKKRRHEYQKMASRQNVAAINAHIAQQRPPRTDNE